MKRSKFSLVETLLIECLFFFAFFGILKLIGLGSPRFFFICGSVLLLGYLLIGIAKVIDIQRREEQVSKM